MNKKAMALAVTTLVSASWGLTTANAQTAANSLPDEILACAEETDVMLRLSCYDREIAAQKSMPPAPAVAPTPVPVAPQAAAVVSDVTTTVVAAQTTAVVSDVTATVVAAPLSAVADVPVVASIPASQPSPAPEPAAEQSTNPNDNFGFDRPPDDITAEIVKIRKQPYGELIVYLDNGQVWEQKHLDRRFKLNVGETVTVKKSAVAGYRLSGDSNKSIQVIRRK